MFPFSTDRSHVFSEGTMKNSYEISKNPTYQVAPRYAVTKTQKRSQCTRVNKEPLFTEEKQKWSYQGKSENTYGHLVWIFITSMTAIPSSMFMPYSIIIGHCDSRLWAKVREQEFRQPVGLTVLCTSGTPASSRVCRSISLWPIWCARSEILVNRWLHSLWSGLINW